MKHRILSLLLIVAVLFGSSQAAFACGPYVLETFFSLKRRPEFPLKQYTSGKVGIVPSTFGPMSLLLFKRHLNGHPLTPLEQEQAVKAMEHSIFYRRSFDDTSDNTADGADERPSPQDLWKVARAKVVEDKREIDTYRAVGNYDYFPNCLSDAFVSATRTLEDRIAKYGVNSEVREWVAGQDLVFANCGEDAAIPAAAASAPAWLQKDRAYQIAAAKFYKTQFADARTDFEAIAGDGNSEWRKPARFVAARTFIREASLLPTGETPDEKAAAATRSKDLLQKAEGSLQKILEDDSMRDFHRSALGLLGLVKFRKEPSDRRAELGRLITETPGENKNFRNDLFDYSILWDRIEDAAYDSGSTLDAEEAKAAGREYDYNYRLKLRDVPAAARTDEATDWVSTYQAIDGFPAAFEKWKASKKADWFVAAISKAETPSPAATELMAEAARTARDSAAYPTVRYHHIRLLLAENRIAEAKKLYDDIGGIERFPLSTQNMFLAQRTAVSTSLDEYLIYAQRKPVLFSYEGDRREEPMGLYEESPIKGWANKKMFDADAAAFFNHKAPLSVLKKAAVDPKLPEHLRKMIATAVWTKAFLLNNSAVEREFAPIVAKAVGNSMPQFAAVASARNAADREANAMIAILRNPVIQPYVPTGFGREDSTPASIDSIRGNWWCTSEHKNMPDVAFPKFLSSGETATAERENVQLAGIGESATALTRRAVAFAEKNPRHPKTPELLHLAVRSTRYGCKDADTGTFSKRAFDILHTRYKTSSWTKQTPYWFQ